MSKRLSVTPNDYLDGIVPVPGQITFRYGWAILRFTPEFYGSAHVLRIAQYTVSNTGLTSGGRSDSATLTPQPLRTRAFCVWFAVPGAAKPSPFGTPTSTQFLAAAQENPFLEHPSINTSRLCSNNFTRLHMYPLMLRSPLALPR